MIFAAPRALWLALLAPLAVVLVLFFWHRYLGRLEAWAQAGLWSRLGLSYSRRRMLLSVACLAFAMAALALALARPRWGAIETTVERRGVDVVFLLDSSLSMATRDVAPSRLAIAKSLVRRLAASLPGHRVALVQAEGQGVVLAPLTIDTAVIDLLLDTVLPASLPDPGTRLGPALTQAIRLYPPDGEKHRVLVMISDGEDHGSAWQEALQSMRDAGVVVHTLGVGTTRGGPVPVAVETREGEKYKQDDDGRIVVSKLGETMLERLAADTGGIYLPVSKPGTDPAPIAAAIDNMDKRSFDTQAFEVLAERFQWPLGLAAATLLVYLLVSPLRSIPALSSEDGS